MAYRLAFFAFFALFFLQCAFLHPAEAAPREEVCRAVETCLARLDNGTKCDVIPVPDDAVFLPPTEPFQLKRLRRGVYQYSDGFFYTLIIRRGYHLVMVDIAESSSSAKPDGSKTRYTDAAEKVMGGKAPRHIDIIYSHEHYDHIGATNLFVDYMKNKYPEVTFDFWGSQSTKRMIEESEVQKAPIPTKFVGPDGTHICIGNDLSIDLKVVGGHAQEDIRIYIPPYGKNQGIVQYVDVVFAKYVTTLDIGITENFGQWIRAQQDILELDFKYLIAGHFLEATKEDMRLNLEYSEDLLRAAQEALDTVSDKDLAEQGIAKFGDPTAAEFGNAHFLVIDVIRAAETKKCYRIMLEKWGCRLAGIDIVGESHCLKALIHVATEL
ncbi:Ribonuclease Z/Hydroxyacylglutathione hydrolase-like protein [Gracilaria domingensis]|nr:Ribonuclease Z/Hydroxyacylglutathione hydrolase-like protein [Gracilaria domingensis]